MSAHVSSVCRSAYCFLRQLRPIIQSLSLDATKIVVLSRRLWTNATYLHMASPTTYSDVYKLCRTLQHAWSPVLEGVTTYINRTRLSQWSCRCWTAYVTCCLCPFADWTSYTTYYRRTLMASLQTSLKTSHV